MLWVERALAREVLPKLAHETRSESLAALLEEHLQQTLGHAANVERVFRLAGAEVSANLDRAAEKLFEQHDELAGSVVHDVLRDLFHAAGAATTEHYELAAYGALLELSRVLELDEASSLLTQNRDEEAGALEKLERVLARLGDELR